MALQVTRRRFTVDEYHRMGDVGLLAEDDRVELIAGEIIEMTPIGSRHAVSVARLAMLFQERLGRRVVVWPQNPIRLGEHSEPQPDVALLRPELDSYASRLPGPEDVLLLVEVADSSLAYDRQIKLPLYASFGVREVWLVDLEAGAIEVYRQPGPSEYAVREVVRRGSAVAAEAVGGLTLRVDDVLGP